jgi:hypothetical protein
MLPETLNGNRSDGPSRATAQPARTMRSPPRGPPESFGRPDRRPVPLRDARLRGRRNRRYPGTVARGDTCFTSAGSMRAFARTGIEAAAPLGASFRVANNPPQWQRRDSARSESARQPPVRAQLGHRRDGRHWARGTEREIPTTDRAQSTAHTPTGFASQMCRVGVVSHIVSHSTQVGGRVLSMLNGACPRRGALYPTAVASRHGALSARRAFCRRSNSSRDLEEE